jgi:hypothetical protein
MNNLYELGGVGCLAFGAWLTIKQIKVFAKGKQDELGFDIKGLGAGIMCIMIGVYLIAHYI